jgi:Sec-independent protein translocase protein TatA
MYDMIEKIMVRSNISIPVYHKKEGGNMGGFHLLNLLVILVIGLLIAGPKALQSMSRNAGKGVGQAKAMKDKVMAELPMEEISEMSQKIPKIPLNAQQAVQMLLTPEQEKNKREAKEENSPSSIE